jgi:hypothetical protein
MACDTNGDSVRTAAAAPGLTCQKDLNVSEDVFGTTALSFLASGGSALSAFPPLQDLAYAAARDAILANFTDAFFVVAAVRALFELQSATLVGLTNPSQTTDYDYGSTLSVKEWWPIECGLISSIATGNTGARVGSGATSSCTDFSPRDTSVLFASPRVLTQSASFPIACAALVCRPYDFFIGTDEPLRPSAYYPFFVIQTLDPITGITFLAKQTNTFSVFNTYNRQRDAIIPANTSLTFLGSAAASAPIQLTVWVSKLDPYGTVPLTRDIISTTQVFGSTSYTFTSSGIPDYADVVGFDVAGAVQGDVITIGNVLVLTPNSTARCQQIGGLVDEIARRIEPRKSVDAPLADKVCMLTQRQLQTRPHSSIPLEIGMCSCPPWWSGLACDAPTYLSLADPVYNAAFGGYGVPGRAKAPDGSLVSVSSSDSDRGLYVWNGVPLGHVLDPGRILWTRLTLTTLSYPSITRVDPNYGAPDFILCTAANGVLAWNTLSTAESIVQTVNGALPSIISATEALEYNGIAPNTTLPVFIDLGFQDYATQGTSDLIWVTRGYVLV